LPGPVLALFDDKRQPVSLSPPAHMGMSRWPRTPFCSKPRPGVRLGRNRTKRLVRRRPSGSRNQDRTPRVHRVRVDWACRARATS
jgi:hypothetical protein